MPFHITLQLYLSFSLIFSSISTSTSLSLSYFIFISISTSSFLSLFLSLSLSTTMHTYNDLAIASGEKAWHLPGTLACIVVSKKAKERGKKKTLQTEGSVLSSSVHDTDASILLSLSPLLFSASVYNRRVA